MTNTLSNKNWLKYTIPFIILTAGFFSSCDKDEDKEEEVQYTVVKCSTDFGDMYIWLHDSTVLHRANFLKLVNDDFYDSTTFHRIIEDFVIQGGDPRGDGYGGPGYMIRDEINLLRYERGRVGMALAGPHTGGSQFFITLSPQPHLDGGYTIFGSVVAGDEILDEIVQGDVIVSAREIPASAR